MYVPKPFRAPDRASVLDLIESAPFSTVVTPDRDDREPVVSHLPVLLVRPSAGDEGWGRLRGHVARGNPHWRLFDGERETLFVFHGPHAYISPTGYADRAAPPTWNYAVAHATGRPRRLEGQAETAAVLDELLARYESAPLELSDAARAALERGIVAFEVAIQKVEAKFKLGQNKSPADRAGTVTALERAGDVERELAAWTRRMTEVA